jgi:diguanylate cyclase (GGDEF)-like protein
LVGWAPAELLGQSALNFLHPDDVEICLSILAYETHTDPSRRSVARQRNIRDIRVVTREGDYRTFEVELTNHYDDPTIGMLLLNVSAPGQHRHLHRFFEHSANQISLPEVLQLLLAEFTTADFGQPAGIISRIDGEVLAHTPNAPQPVGPMAAEVFQTRWQRQLIATSGSPIGQIDFFCPLASPHPFDVEASERIANIASALIERAQFSDELAAAALMDPLTGISNRRALEHDLQRRTEASENTVVVYVDLDRFKQINDHHGHPVGDAVLVSVADRLQRSVRKGDLVARVGGDEFVVLLGNQPDSLADVCQRLHQLISAPMAIEDHVFRISASIGVGVGSDAGSLLREADTNMMQSKRRSTVPVRV